MFLQWRLVSIALGVSLAALAVAAPAPLPRRERAETMGPWFAGWDRPICPVGVCKFDRHQDRLTITILDDREPSDSDPARLMRAVQGDFTATVRVQLPETPKLDEDCFLMAGLYLHSEEMKASFGATTIAEPNRKVTWHLRATYNERETVFPTDYAHLVERAGVTLRMSRRGTSVYICASDGLNWEREWRVTSIAEQAKGVKIGAFVRWDGKAKARVVFDQFTLTTK